MLISEEKLCEELKLKTRKGICDELGINGNPKDPMRDLIERWHPYSTFNTCLEVGVTEEVAIFLAAESKDNLERIICFSLKRDYNLSTHLNTRSNYLFNEGD